MHSHGFQNRQLMDAVNQPQLAALEVFLGWCLSQSNPLHHVPPSAATRCLPEIGGYIPYSQLYRSR
jgi:hypothetical protein